MKNNNYPDSLIAQELSKPKQNEEMLQQFKCVYAGPDYWNKKPPVGEPVVQVLNTDASSPDTAATDDGRLLCSVCGNPVEKYKFCPECGSPVKHD